MNFFYKVEDKKKLNEKLPESKTKLVIKKLECEVYLLHLFSLFLIYCETLWPKWNFWSYFSFSFFFLKKFLLDLHLSSWQEICKNLKQQSNFFLKKKIIQNQFLKDFDLYFCTPYFTHLVGNNLRRLLYNKKVVINMSKVF